MSGVKWIKLSTGMFEDEKIRLIESMPEADTILVIWVKLLTLAGKKNIHGEVFVNEDIPYTDEMLATIFHRPINRVRMALDTFAKFRMIEIDQDKTIHICNWFKHQNLEGLEKIRTDTAERVRRFREKKRATFVEQYLEDVTRYKPLQDRYSVTQKCVTERYQNKNKSTEEDKDPLPSPKVGGLPKEAIESDDPMELEEATLWFNTLFHRNRPWTYEEQQLLTKIVPISRDDVALLTWAHKLPPDHRFFEQTKLKQELTTLVREFNGEIDKIKSVRRALGMNGPAKCK